MNNFNPYLGMYYQFWMVPNTLSTSNAYFTPVPMYPQFMQSQPVNQIITLPQPEQAEKIYEVKQKEQNKQEPKSQKQQVHDKTLQDKITVQFQSNLTKQQSLKDEEKKPKRPPTYLTQKAFYMKHKLKGKQKNGARILRRRPKGPELKKQIKVQHPKTVKKIKTEPKIKKQKYILAKDPEKQKKILNKIKTKVWYQVKNEFAAIPALISGVTLINEYCQHKRQNLMRRKITKSWP